MDTTYRKLLSEFKTAMLAIAMGGQSYTINGRTFTKANLGEIQKAIDWLEDKAVSEADPTGDNTGFILARVADIQ